MLIGGVPMPSQVEKHLQLTKVDAHFGKFPMELATFPRGKRYVATSQGRRELINDASIALPELMDAITVSRSEIEHPVKYDRLRANGVYPTLTATVVEGRHTSQPVNVCGLNGVALSEVINRHMDVDLTDEERNMIIAATSTEPTFDVDSGMQFKAAFEAAPLVALSSQTPEEFITKMRLRVRALVSQRFVYNGERKGDVFTATYLAASHAAGSEGPFLDTLTTLILAHLYPMLVRVIIANSQDAVEMHDLATAAALACYPGLCLAVTPHENWGIDVAGDYQTMGYAAQLINKGGLTPQLIPVRYRDGIATPDNIMCNRAPFIWSSFSMVNGQLSIPRQSTIRATRDLASVLSSVVSGNWSAFTNEVGLLIDDLDRHPDASFGATLDHFHHLSRVPVQIPISPFTAAVIPLHLTVNDRAPQYRLPRSVVSAAISEASSVFHTAKCLRFGLHIMRASHADVLRRYESSRRRDILWNLMLEGARAYDAYLGKFVKTPPMHPGQLRVAEEDLRLKDPRFVVGHEDVRGVYRYALADEATVEAHYMDKLNEYYKYSHGHEVFRISNRPPVVHDTTGRHVCDGNSARRRPIVNSRDATSGWEFRDHFDHVHNIVTYPARDDKRVDILVYREYIAAYDATGYMTHNDGLQRRDAIEAFLRGAVIVCFQNGRVVSESFRLQHNLLQTPQEELLRQCSVFDVSFEIRGKVAYDWVMVDKRVSPGNTWFTKLSEDAIVAPDDTIHYEPVFRIPVYYNSAKVNLSRHIVNVLPLGEHVLTKVFSVERLVPIVDVEVNELPLNPVSFSYTGVTWGEEPNVVSNVSLQPLSTTSVVPRDGDALDIILDTVAEGKEDLAVSLDVGESKVE
jgi:hypothetical protein